jgi:hypothetical protein
MSTAHMNSDERTTREAVREAVQESMDRRDNGGETGH